MNRFVKLALWLLVVGALLCTGLVVAALHWAMLPDNAVISINDESFTLAQLQGGQWLLVLGGVLLALIVVLLVVPFVVLVPLLCAALGIAIALCAVLGVLGLVFSPLLLLGWIVWRLARSPSNKPAATMRA
jgi:hypothetical protein